MEGYKKTAFINHKGETLFPWTTASMVSEESDRRFVDNIEKKTLNKIATGGTALDEILGLSQQNLGSVSILVLGYRDTVEDKYAAAAKVRKSTEDLYVKL